MAFFEVKNLNKTFGGLRAINGLNFVVEEGKIFAIIGPNGAGKTTIFNCINKLFPVENGEILFRGEDILKLRPHDIPLRGIARTFQNIALFSKMTVVDNILVGKHGRMKTGLLQGAFRSPRSRAEEKEVLEKARELIRFLGLEAVQNQLVSGLPFGYQKKVELARALSLEPKLLLLDEPVGGMNIAETEAMGKLIKEIRGGMGITIILVEHDMRLVMGVSDRICVLNYGEKITEGVPTEIKNNPLVIEAYLGRGKADAQRG